MNLQLKTLQLILIKYELLLKKVTIPDAEYLAWVSIAIDSSEWPKEGDFISARADSDFRDFRQCMKELSLVMNDFNYGLGFFPYSTRKEYIERYKQENPEGVPF